MVNNKDIADSNTNNSDNNDENNENYNNSAELLEKSRMNKCGAKMQEEVAPVKATSAVVESKEDFLEQSAATKIVSVIPRERQQLIKWNGWGYKDSKFQVNGITETTTKYDPSIFVSFSGTRYPIGNTNLPYFAEWVISTFGLDLRNQTIAKPLPTIYPEPLINEEFLENIKKFNILYSHTGEDRLIRSHGQTLADIHTLRDGQFGRIPDLIVWPTSHNDVVKIIKLANENNVTIIPFGGGTSVSGSISCPQNENRSICILDTSQMNRMLWLDRNDLIACFECGIFGQDLERELRKIGLTVGHEPDSYEFSTLGGWVATRASGMKKNTYGNIEDLVVRVKMVTSKGVLERNCSAPRVSIGPDFNHLIMGSEGTLGVITEVVLKVRKLPAAKQYGSLVFPTFEDGIKCLREIAEHRLQPASIRLIDNEQFKFGQALKPAGSYISSVLDSLKKTYLTRVKGFDLTKMCVATLLFEGEAEDLKRQEKQINQIALKYNGIAAGAENGERGYVLTFVIAYIRDFALEFFIVAESFETSVPWNRCEMLCTNTKNRVRKECSKLNIKNYLICCRVTQTYDAGAAVYFYFGYNYLGIDDPVHTYEFIENCARDEILSCGGSLSHHHGVGKLRSRWYKQSIGNVGVNLYKAAKNELDPKNIFAAGNLLTDNDQELGMMGEFKLNSKL